MPNPFDDDVDPRPQITPFDDDLIDLGVKLESVRRDGESDLRDTRLLKICTDIKNIEAQGLAGLFVKTRAAEVLAQQEEPEASLDLARSVAGDLASFETRLGACPIERLIWEACALIEAMQMNNPKKTDDAIEEDRLMSERLDFLQAAALSAPARSTLGAMFQIYALADLVDEIEDVGSSQVIFRKMRRGLYSLLSLLEALAGQRVEIYRAFSMSTALDPFARDEEAA